MTGQLGAAIRGLADQPGDRGKLRLVGNGVGQDIDRAGDDGEHVVEVVRDAAGELADRLHLLRLPQLLFGRELLRDVAQEQVEDIAVAAAHAGHRHFHLDRPSVLAAGIELEADRR